MPHRVLALHLCFTLFCMTTAELQAETKLPSIIGSNMVLQRDQAVPIWGWDDPGTKVTVKFAGQTISSTANDEGRWHIRLKPLKAAESLEMTIQGTSQVKLSNVAVGEVWLCSGQSNMEWTVSNSNNPKEEIAAADFPGIRHIKIPHTPKATPQTDVPSSGWQPTSPQTVGSFTAVGYFFGRKLHQELGVPIGLIGSNWGGTRIEPWTPPVGFKKVPDLNWFSDRLDEFPQKKADGNINHQSPTALYNGMIAPLVPYGIRGAIWYQGESNRGEGMLYYEKMKGLIYGWRELWDNPEMPFYFVQLAPYRYRGSETALPEIQVAQTAALQIPNTGMAVTVDIGNVDDIHPRNKQDVGKRLALWALAKDYGQNDLVYSGPIYKSMKVDGNNIVLHFDHVGDGLTSRDGKPLTHFEIAGEDGTYVSASAKIVGETVVVNSDEVKQPKSVRFAWHQLAEPNLSNNNGLPAGPFEAK